VLKTDVETPLAHHAFKSAASLLSHDP